MAKIKVITGANKGIGLGLARYLGEQGDKIIGTARDPEAATALKALPNVIGIVKFDLSDLDSIPQVAEDIAKLAPDGIDELWNNAGQAVVKGPITTRDMKAFREQLNLNVVGTSAITQALIPLLRKRSTRKIIFVASGMGSHTVANDIIAGHLQGLDMPPSEDFFGMSTYQTSKSAMIMEAICWHGALYPEGFTIYPFHPGWVRTDLSQPNADLSIDEAVPVFIKTVAGLQRKPHIMLLNYDGTVMGW